MAATRPPEPIWLPRGGIYQSRDGERVSPYSKNNSKIGIFSPTRRGLWKSRWQGWRPYAESPFPRLRTLLSERAWLAVRSRDFK